MRSTDTAGTRMSSSARFWDRMAASYARRPVTDEAVYQRKLSITQGYLRPDMDVLEFGCGTGSTALAHAARVKRILAIDISARMIEIARGKAAESGVTNVDFQRAGVEDFDAPAASFDAILGLNILHLVEDMDATIAKVHGLLKPGGVFVSSTACLGDGMSYFRFIAPVGLFLGLLPVLRVFTADKLADTLIKRGFAIDHRWQPGKRKAVFLVATKAG